MRTEIKISCTSTADEEGAKMKSDIGITIIVVLAIALIGGIAIWLYS